MKHIACILLLLAFSFKLFAQDTVAKKPPTLAFHVFYNDFKTAQLIRTTSLSNVLSNGLWSPLGDTQMGFGFNYLQGISPKIDLVTTLDASSTDYLFKDGTTNGSSRLLLDANAGLNFKLLTDSHTLAPYLMAGAGFSLYNSKAGLYLPAGVGLQVNLFNEAFIFTNFQYRYAVSPAVNNHFQYNIGVAASLAKKKKPKPVVPPTVAPEPIVTPITAPVVEQIAVKNIQISVTDELTKLPLSGAAVVITGPAGELKGITDANGQTTFNNVSAAEYTISGTLHGIATNVKPLTKSNFDGAGKDLQVNLSHNDPQFSLAGRVINKSTGKPEQDVDINLTNITQNSSINTKSAPNDGSFSLQLQPGSSFTVSGKKANYISNIETLSTKGLNRSTTLYVKLELAIEEAAPDKVISLKNIYYDMGSIKIRPGASSDLEKLVLFLKDNPGTRIEIASHTDSRGSDAVNMKLSQARAQEVVNYLTKNGIDKKRLVPKGYGETKPVNGCVNGVKCTEAQYEQNRRTEFKVITN